jgi:hypothetical protein
MSVSKSLSNDAVDQDAQTETSSKRAAEGDEESMTILPQSDTGIIRLKREWEGGQVVLEIRESPDSAFLNGSEIQKLSPQFFKLLRYLGRHPKARRSASDIQKAIGSDGDVIPMVSRLRGAIKRAAAAAGIPRKDEFMEALLPEAKEGLYQICAE